MHGLEKVLNTHRSSDSIREAFVEPEPQWMGGCTAATGLGYSRKREKKKNMSIYTYSALICSCTTVNLEIFVVIVLRKIV